MKTILALALFVCFVSYGEAYFFGRCRKCELAVSLDQCYTWADCDTKTEICYMEEVITQANEIRYNGGCRAIDVCRNPTIGKRSEDETDYIACSRCCKDRNYCNEELCGIKKTTTLTYCNSCDGSKTGLHAPPPQYPEDCGIRTICQRDEMCFASTIPHGDSSLRHFTSCMNIRQCQKLVETILNLNHDFPDMFGKREVDPICAVCCGDDNCNNIACEAIKGRLIALDQDGWLNRTSLKEII